MTRVLIIEDAATVRLYYRSILSDSGYEVDEAINGIEGLEKAVSTECDLFIVDVNMAHLDGCSFLRELRALPVRQVPAIVISSEAMEDGSPTAFQSGANAYLTKPVTPEQLQLDAALLTGRVA